MGLLFRPRRPLLRLATGAATAGIAYHAGKSRAQQDVYNEEAAAAYQATQPPQAPAAGSGPGSGPVPAGDPATAELERLARLHQSGELTDQEYAAAKAKLLGI